MAVYKKVLEFGGDCHLAAHVIGNAASSFDLDGIDLLISYVPLFKVELTGYLP